ncbi:MAG: NAD(P)-binding protein [Rhizobiales bacterium]|nr:NAD(P)-binding protein [Hyphomicrobiales bacterium]
MGIKARIGIVGAGLAGLTCARQLRDAGHMIEVFERDGLLGGRLQTERDDAVRYDSGAQYVTARTREFKRLLDSLALAGHASGWSPRLLLGGSDLVGEIAPQDWYVGIPGMGSLVRPLADDVRVNLNARVRGLQRVEGRWMLQISDRDEMAGPFHAVLLTAPAPESYPLLADHEELFDEMTRVRMLPCWTVLLQFAAPLPVEFDVGARLTESIAWIARDSSKPNRKRGQENWVLQSSPEFSRQFLEEEPEDVARQLWLEMQSALGLVEVTPMVLNARLWRHALVERTLGASCIFSRDAMLGAAGDWCLGSRAEAAFESASALVRRVREALS